MKITEAIILAGGLGTRLRSAVPDLPKCMAPVAGKPFLAYVIDYYKKQGIEQFIFSLGYRHQDILDYLKLSYPELSYSYVVESEPLGTGGAIQLALSNAMTHHQLILNGDTLFQIELSAIAAFHKDKKALCTLSLKPMTRFDRYGVVEISPEGTVKQFSEKKYYDSGLINGGVYILNKERFLENKRPLKFSFEKDFLEVEASQGTLFGIPQEGYFIDIGIPEDFQKAQTELPAL